MTTGGPARAFRSMFGGFGSATNATSITFISQPSLSACQKGWD